MNNMISYNEFLTLCTFNYLYPDCTITVTSVASRTVAETEGDPRGNITQADAQTSFEFCLAQN